MGALKSILNFLNKYISLKIRLAAPYYYHYNSYKKIPIDRDDPYFAQLSETIINEARTYLRHDRLYVIYQLIKQIPMSTNVAEVGVYKGGSSKFIASVLENENKDTKIYSCDTFTGHAVVNEQYDGEHRANQDFSDVVFSEVVDYLAEYRNIQIIKGDIFNTIDRISPGRLLGLIHLDVDVYPATKFVLENLHEKLATGGFIICDDYGFVTCLGARKAVEEFIETQKSNYLSLHLLTGQIVLVKK